MSNQQLKIGFVALVLSALIIFATTALPAANALTPSTVYDTRGHKTDRFPGGQHICGDKLCSSDEWAKMKNALHKAQRNTNLCSELKSLEYCGQIQKN